MSVPPHCTALGCLAVIRSWLGPRAPPRCAVAQPHVLATRTGPSPAHTLVPSLSPTRCPAGSFEHNLKLRIWGRRKVSESARSHKPGEEMCKFAVIQTVKSEFSSQARPACRAELATNRPEAQAAAAGWSLGIFHSALAARGQRVQCWNQAVQRSVQGVELPNALGLQGRHRAAATAPGALPRAGRKGGSAAPLREKPSGTSRGHYVTLPQPGFRRRS